jgi:predicted Rossmann fold nucleotide-binding protein DprA/Smf involved in DNA uptake
MNDKVRDPLEVIRDEMVMRDKVLAVLNDGPKTVPEIAEVMDYPASEVMYWVMAARKYGYIEAIKEPTEDDYFQYKLVKNE